MKRVLKEKNIDMEKIILILLLHSVLTVSGTVSNTQMEGEPVLQVISIAQSTVNPDLLTDCKNKHSNLKFVHRLFYE